MCTDLTATLRENLSDLWRTRCLHKPKLSNHTRITFKEIPMVTKTEGTGVINLNEVEDLDGISVLRGGGSGRGWNGIQYKQGMSAKNVGSQGLSINVATVPPGAIAYAHIHDGFEVMLFIVQGRVK